MPAPQRMQKISFSPERNLRAQMHPEPHGFSTENAVKNHVKFSRNKQIEGMIAVQYAREKLLAESGGFEPPIELLIL